MAEYVSLLRKATIDYASMDLPQLEALFMNQLRDGYLREAVATLKAMRECGFQRGAHLFEEVIRVWSVKRGRIENATEVFVELAKEGLELTETLYACIIAAYAGEKKMLKAMKLFEEMKGTWVARAADEDSAIAEVEAFEAQAKKAGQVLTPEEEVAYAAELERRGRILYFKGVWGRDAGLEVVANTYASLIEGWCCIGEFVKAEELFNEVLSYEAALMHNVSHLLSEKEKKNKIFLFGAKPDATQSDDVSVAQGLREKMGKEVAVFNAMLLGYGKRRQIKKVKQLLAEMEARGLEKDKKTYLALLEAYYNSGNVAKVEQVAKELVEKKVPLRVAPFDVFAVYQHQLRTYAKVSDLQKIVALFDGDMAAAGLKPTVTTFNKLLEEFSQQDERNCWLGIRFVFEEMITREVKASLSTLDLLLACDDVEHVLRILEDPKLNLLLSLEDPHWKLLASACDKYHQHKNGTALKAKELKAKLGQLIETRDKLLEEQKGEDEEEEDEDVDLDDF